MAEEGAKVETTKYWQKWAQDVIAKAKSYSYDEDDDEIKALRRVEATGQEPYFTLKGFSASLDAREKGEGKDGNDEETIGRGSTATDG